MNSWPIFYAELAVKTAGVLHTRRSSHLFLTSTKLSETETDIDLLSLIFSSVEACDISWPPTLRSLHHCYRGVGLLKAKCSCGPHRLQPLVQAFALFGPNICFHLVMTRRGDLEAFLDNYWHIGIIDLISVGHEKYYDIFQKECEVHDQNTLLRAARSYISETLTRAV